MLKLTREAEAFLKLSLQAYKGIATDGKKIALLDRMNRVIYVDRALVGALNLNIAIPRGRSFNIYEVIRFYESTSNGKRGNANRATK